MPVSNFFSKGQGSVPVRISSTSSWIEYRVRVFANSGVPRQSGMETRRFPYRVLSLVGLLVPLLRCSQHEGLVQESMGSSHALHSTLRAVETAEDTEH